MKRTGHKSIIHLYALLFIILAAILTIGYSMIVYAVSTVKPDGETVLNRWPIEFTQSFATQIVLIDRKPQVTDTGIELLAKNNLWLQVIDESGHEVANYEKPPSISEQYSPMDLLELYQIGGDDTYTPFIGSLTASGEKWTYIIGFPVQISKLTIYVDAQRFTSGKPIFLMLIGFAALLTLLLGGAYGFWTTRQLSKIIGAVKQIAARTYLKIADKSQFGDVYHSLNTLDAEIRASDEERAKNEQMREDWIANITHDLKTPLSPIKGYAELLTEADGDYHTDNVRKYAGIILKNTAYVEVLIDDLKLTYQLKNAMIPIHRREENMTRFMKELIIDILNHPRYGDRKISFTGQDAPITYHFDHALMQRAFNNLLYNALVHNPEETEIAISVVVDSDICIKIKDNGKGMRIAEQEKLFERYYRGTNTEEISGSTGLGMAIAKQIIELHDGSIFVESNPNTGTCFTIHFPVLY